VKKKRVVALLESMWGDRPGNPGIAPRAFHINPYNFSGSRLYRMMRGSNGRLLVTNCCKEMQTSAKGHGTPDPAYVAANLAWLKPDLLLVCGRVAQRTYTASGYLCPVLLMPHPAARNWTNEALSSINKQILRIVGIAQPC
jgi:hypothetical protein